MEPSKPPSIILISLTCSWLNIALQNKIVVYYTVMRVLAALPEMFGRSPDPDGERP